MASRAPRGAIGGAMLTTARVLALPLLLASSAPPAGLAAQALPPPRDGDVRALYWELQNETQVWLTLQPQGTEGKTAPILAFTLRFAGKRPAAPPAEIELRASVGMIWAPRVDLSITLDEGPRLQLPAVIPLLASFQDGSGFDSVTATLAVEMLQRMADAKRVAGSALGVDFELNEGQRRAIRLFLDRVRSDNPGRFR